MPVRTLPTALFALALGCAGPRPAPVAVPVAAPAEPAAAAVRPPDPDLHRPPPRRLLDLDWAHLPLATDADALAVWQRIAPTDADWEDKLQEVPAEAARPLALALLRGGNFTCMPPAPAIECAPPRFEVDPPAAAAGFTDPCLRRLLALWSLAQLDEDDAPAVADPLRAIAAIPPPESQLVAAALRAYPEAAFDARLELAAIAWRAGQHELVDAMVGALDEAHLIQAVRTHHIASALEILSAEGHRAVYLAAVTDDALEPRARVAAISELAALADKPPADLARALVAAVKAKDCAVAAAAARALDQHGDHRFVPRKPRTTDPAVAMRAVCVLASFEVMQRSDEASLLASYLPPTGLERVTITLEPPADDAPAGAPPRTSQTTERLSRADAVLPELTDLVRAVAHCTGTICVSDDHEFRFVWKPAGGELWLTRIEIADRPGCPSPAR